MIDGLTGGWRFRIILQVSLQITGVTTKPVRKTFVARRSRPEFYN